MPKPGMARTLRGRFGLRAFLLALIITETLAITSGFIWRSEMIDTLVTGLETHVESVASELDLGLAEALEQRTDASVFVLPAPESGIQIISGEGTILAASPLLSDEPPLLAVGSLPDGELLTATIDHPIFGRSMIAATQETTSTGTYAIETIASLAEVDRACLIMCVAMPVAMIGVSAVIGWAVYTAVDSSLRPVRRLTRRAAEIAGTARPEPLGVTAHTAEFRDLAEQLDRLLEAIRVALEREQSFLDDASHELRTPIAVALAELDLALREDPDPMTSEALRSARAELLRLDAVARDLLVLARERSTGLDTYETFDIAGVARRALDLVRRDPELRPVRVDVTGHGEVSGDPWAMERVFTNLISNAVRHCTLTVEVTVGSADGEVWAAVSDDGPGIPDHLLPDLFNRFTRQAGHVAHSTGLGTAIAAEIIAKHGGTITASNTQTRGARIEIRLPADPDSRPALQPESTAVGDENDPSSDREG